VTQCDAVPQGVLLYTKPQVAALLQVSVRCLSRMMQRCEIPYLKINRKLVRFRAEDVLRRLSEMTLVGNGDPAGERGNQSSVIGNQLSVKRGEL
jgi:excisionase family DNA binding protein